jgi:hypothetical protein
MAATGRREALRCVVLADRVASIGLAVRPDRPRSLNNPRLALLNGGVRAPSDLHPSAAIRRE